MAIQTMQQPDLSSITTDKIALPLSASTGIESHVLRLDKIHPVISGNKWFKLRYYIDDALQQNAGRIITFGGAWSNHIVASAAIAKIHGLKSLGIIRGERAPTPSSTLETAAELGMELIFIPRDEYSQKKFPQAVKTAGDYIIPEGGYGPRGAAGASTILKHCHLPDYTHILCATGTGTMMAGLINEALPHQQVIGISVLKNKGTINNEISALLNVPAEIQINHGFDFNGYARYNPVLIRFMNDLYIKHNIPSDFVYTAKLFYAVNELAADNFFPENSRLLLIHSGGLQGNASLDKGTLMF